MNKSIENNPLHLGLEIDFSDGSQPFEMIDAVNNSGTGWFGPRTFLRNLPDVVRADYWQTGSSAGDWNGWYAVRREVENDYALVWFDQENNYPGSEGYTLRTDDRAFAYVESNDVDLITEVVQDHLEMYYGV